MLQCFIGISTNSVDNKNLIQIVGDQEIEYVDVCILNLIIRGFGATPLLISDLKDLQKFKDLISGIILPGSYNDSSLDFFKSVINLPENLCIDEKKIRLIKV